MSSGVTRGLMAGGGVTALILAASLQGGIASAQTAPAASGPTTLPAVTVDEPRQRTTRRAATTPARTAPRRATAVSRPRQPVQAQPVARPVNPNSTITPLPVYAGGQVATGGQLGLLGNRGLMSTPFNTVSYTAETIQNQQARTVGDLLNATDPSTRVVTPAGSGFDVLYIRGFFVDNGSIGLNGLYGIAPNYSISANFAERIEVVKGPGALLTGILPTGAIGGSVNIVTKKAPDFDITQLTGTYTSRSQFGTLVDIARRYGQDKEWGIRFNGSYRNGDTPFDRQTQEFGNAVVGLDYRTTNVRVSADVGHQVDNLNPPIRFIGNALPAGTTVFPRAPDPGTNFTPSQAFLKFRDTFAVVRGEADVSDKVTVYGAIGMNDSTADFLYSSPNITDTSGNYRSTPIAGRDAFRTVNGEAGVRADLDTGPINHNINVAYSQFDRANESNFLSGGLAGQFVDNIYNPRPVVYAPLLPSTRNLSTTEARSIGIADTMSLADKRIQLTVGVRRQIVETEVFSRVTNTTTSSVDGAAWSPAYALVVRPTDRLSLYANYIEGLQAGQVVGAGAANAGQVFPPFASVQKEIGAKYDFGRITTTISAFEITRPNLINIAGLPLPTAALDGEQRNRGIEIFAFGEITQNIRVLGGATFLDGRQTKTLNGANDGKKAVGVPDFLANLGLEWDTPFLRGLTLTGRTIYTDEQFVNTNNTLTIPSWARVDLGARYTFLSPWNGKPIVLRAAVENVGNVAYFSSGYTSLNSAAGSISVGAPRTYLMSSTFNF